MNILGINGWLERSHDASACLIADGRLIAYVEEERLIRQKHSFDRLPLNSIAYCLQAADFSPDEIDLIAWGWELPKLHDLHGRAFPYDERRLNDLLFPRKYYPGKKKVIPIQFVDHHLAHAASAYASRPDEQDMPILVIDGSGEDVSVSLFVGQDGRLTRKQDFPVLDSPGLFYGAACQYLGFSWYQAGKLMGLASYGEADAKGAESFFDSEGRSSLTLDLGANGILDWGEEITNGWLEIFKAKWGKINNPRYAYSNLKGSLQPSLALGNREKDLAAIFQKELESLHVLYARKALGLIPGSRRLGLAGGVSLNCSANGLLMDQGIVEELVLHPAANDAGVALGAAAVAMGKIPAGLFSTPYLGPGFSPDDIRKCLEGSGLRFSEPPDLNQELALSLARGRTIGYFQGRMEIGPRALGARSILADPSVPEINPLVNQIKSRETWRPLAPSILEGESSAYFNRSADSPYMLIRNFVRPEKTGSIPAIVHVDGSVRPQAVRPGTNPGFYDLLAQFQKVNQLPLVLNTSFNNEKEPIVCTPADALRTFFEVGLDELAIGPFLVKKRGG